MAATGIPVVRRKIVAGQRHASCLGFQLLAFTLALFALISKVITALLGPKAKRPLASFLHRNVGIEFIRTRIEIFAKPLNVIEQVFGVRDANQLRVQARWYGTFLRRVVTVQIAAST